MKKASPHREAKTMRIYLHRPQSAQPLQMGLLAQRAQAAR
jgi:hypothetical protein